MRLAAIRSVLLQVVAVEIAAEVVAELRIFRTKSGEQVVRGQGSDDDTLRLKILRPFVDQEEGMGIALDGPTDLVDDIFAPVANIECENDHLGRRNGFVQRSTPARVLLRRIAQAEPIDLSVLVVSTAVGEDLAIVSYAQAAATQLLGKSRYGSFS